MITKIGLENFKAFGKRVDIDLGGVTVLSGLNSSGKSSVYQSLLLLVQSRQSKVKIGDSFVPTLKINGDFLTIGTKKELLNDTKNNNIKFFIEWDNGAEYINLDYQYFEEQGVKDYILTKLECKYDQDIWIKLEFDLKHFTWTVEASLLLGFDNSTFGSILEYFLRNKFKNIKEQNLFNTVVKFCGVKNLEFSGFSPKSLEINFEDFIECVHPDSRDIEVNVIKELFEDMVLNKKREATYLRLRNNSGESKISHFFEGGIAEIPAFRGVPQRIYNETNHPNPLHGYVLKRKNLIPYFYNLDSNTILKGTLEEALNFWASDKFKLADSVSVEEVLADYSTEILFKLKDKVVPINNMGFGVSQVLPVIFRTLLAEKNKLLIIDEPEIHLHPSAQAKLADFFFQMMILEKKLFIETHSETLLNKLILNLINYPNFKNKIKLLWIEREEGSSSSQEIAFDELGFLINSPKGFLDEGSALTKEFTSSRLKTIKKNE